MFKERKKGIVTMLKRKGLCSTHIYFFLFGFPARKCETALWCMHVCVCICVYEYTSHYYYLPILHHFMHNKTLLLFNRPSILIITWIYHYTKNNFFMFSLLFFLSFMSSSLNHPKDRFFYYTSLPSYYSLPLLISLSLFFLVGF